MTANAVSKSYFRLEQKPVTITPVAVTLHYQGVSPRDHRCLCSVSTTVFLSLIFFLKTLVSRLHNKDPKFCCMGNRNKLYIKFGPEGSEVIGPAITPALLTNSWRLRGLAQLNASPAESSDTLSVSSARKSRAASKLLKRQSLKLASLPMWMSEKLDLEKNWQHGSSEKKTIKTTCKGSAWASSPHFRSKSSQIRYAILAAFCTIN